MKDKPEFLQQLPALTQRDRDLQKQLKEEARARGVVPTKDSRRMDFIARSIEETQKALRETDNAGRSGLKGRLTFLREEFARLNS